MSLCCLVPLPDPQYSRGLSKVFIHKGGIKGLDCMASDQSRPGFYKFSFRGVLHFVFWDLMFNDTFVMCSSVFAQALETAIGGSASA